MSSHVNCIHKEKVALCLHDNRPVRNCEPIFISSCYLFQVKDLEKKTRTIKEQSPESNKQQAS